MPQLGNHPATRALRRHNASSFRPGYTLPMGRVACLCALALSVAAANAVAADPRLVDGVSGAPIAWSDWVARRGPVAVLVWASWAPNAEVAIDQHPQLEAVCAEAGMHLVVLDVQETLEEGRRALEGRDVGWLHDRHGALLKNYRVITVPSVLIVSAEGEALARLDATAEAVRAWSAR